MIQAFQENKNWCIIVPKIGKIKFLNLELANSIIKLFGLQREEE